MSKPKTEPAFKTVGYAYPSSPRATSLLHAKTGCWYVDSGWVVSCFDTKAEALAFAETLPEPYHPYSHHQHTRRHK